MIGTRQSTGVAKENWESNIYLNNVYGKYIAAFRSLPKSTDINPLLPLSDSIKLAKIARTRYKPVTIFAKRDVVNFFKKICTKLFFSTISGVSKENSFRFIGHFRILGWGNQRIRLFLPLYFTLLYKSLNLFANLGPPICFCWMRNISIELRTISFWF